MTTREAGYRSVADVIDPASLEKVRDYKKQNKAAAKAEADLTWALSHRTPPHSGGSPHEG